MSVLRLKELVTKVRADLAAERQRDYRKTPVNITSGNVGNGVTLTERTRDNFFDKNYIGVNRTRGTLPNTGQPVSDAGTRSVFLGP